MADILAETDEDHPFPYALRNLVLERDQVIDFYNWVLDEQALGTRLFMKDFSAERIASAVENWKTAHPEAKTRLDVRFKRPDDAVFVRMKFT